MTITQQRQHDAVRGSAVHSADALAALSLVLNFGSDDWFDDVNDALVLAPYIAGSQPWARAKRIERLRDGVTLLPPGVTPVRELHEHNRESRLAAGEGWTLRAVRANGTGSVMVTADSPELAEAMLALATQDAAQPPSPPEGDEVDVGFWHLTTHGPRRRTRPIQAPHWADIRRNYTAPAAEAFDRLVALTGGVDLSGRMLLVHGPPGTGKTTALRALAREWRQWCQVDFVIDPERLFGDSGYLIELVLGETDKDGLPWRLLLLEDCDELIRSDAKRATGQALSRLLNLTDGLLGQGRQVLVALTTNEDVSALHPAVTRPGRCLAEIEVGALTYAEATAWLGTSAAVDPRGTTLAALFAARDGEGPVLARERPAETGLYL
jgi:hypothetical protein